MTTRECMESLPEIIRERIEAYRSDYKSAARVSDEDKRYIEKMIARAELWGYIKGLRDAGIITEQQRKILTIYGSV